MMALEYKGRTDPTDDEALAELRTAVDANTVAFAVIDDGKSRTVYTNLEGAEACEVLTWLLEGVLEGLIADLLKTSPGVQ